MPKKDFLLRKLQGQVEQWDDEIYKLTCEIRDTSEGDIKSECEKKINDLEQKRSNAMDEIEKINKDKNLD
jgi:hypothetical protein